MPLSSLPSHLSMVSEKQQSEIRKHKIENRKILRMSFGLVVNFLKWNPPLPRDHGAILIFRGNSIAAELDPYLAVFRINLHDAPLELQPLNPIIPYHYRCRLLKYHACDLFQKALF